MKCPTCGTENDAANRFCDQCGSRLDAGAAAPSPQAALASQPTAAAATCPSCGAVVLPGEAFCDECGASLSGVAAPPVAGAASYDAPAGAADAERWGTRDARRRSWTGLCSLWAPEFARRSLLRQLWCGAHPC